MQQKPSYEPLLRVLSLAYEQAAYGKGAKRHANGRDFDRQPILEYGRIVGPAGTAFQAQKKIGEAISHHFAERGDRDAANRELFGAIVYCAATVMLIEHEGLPTLPERLLVDMASVQPPPPPPTMLAYNDTPPSPVKFDGPTVRILEADWLELRRKADAYDATTPWPQGDAPPTATSITKSVDDRSKDRLADAMAKELGVAPAQAPSQKYVDALIDSNEELGKRNSALRIANKAMHEALRAVVVICSNNPGVQTNAIMAKLSGFSLPEDLRTACDAVEARRK